MGVLCVDDEPNVLVDPELHLRRECSVVTATSGAAGLSQPAWNAVPSRATVRTRSVIDGIRIEIDRAPSVAERAAKSDRDEAEPDQHHSVPSPSDPSRAATPRLAM